MGSTQDRRRCRPRCPRSYWRVPGCRSRCGFQGGYHALEYVSGCIAVGADIFVIGEDWGTKSHNLDVDAYLKEMGKEIAQVRYNPRTSSTKIKQMVLAQFQARARPH